MESEPEKSRDTYRALFLLTKIQIKTDRPQLNLQIDNNEYSAAENLTAVMIKESPSGNTC